MEEVQEDATSSSFECSGGGKTSSKCEDGRHCSSESFLQLNATVLSLQNDQSSDMCQKDETISFATETSKLSESCTDGHCESSDTSYRNLLGRNSQSDKTLSSSTQENFVPNNAAAATVALRHQDAIEARPSTESAPSIESNSTELAPELEVEPSAVEIQALEKLTVETTVDRPEKRELTGRKERTSETTNQAIQNGTGSDTEGEPLETALDEIVTAIDSFTALDSNQLTFKRGDQIHIISKNSEEWWWAELNGCHGYIPVNHITAKSLEELESELWQDEEYFGSYSSLKLQLEMLNDKPRTMAYRTAIERNAEFLKDKVVMDLGCGTGILSLFCARYGRPKKIYAVEASRMADKAKRLILYNGYWDVVKVIHDRVENIALPEKVDLIISEWMGTLLLFELMVESVLIARDKFLAKGGVMWPSHAKLYLVPCSAQKQFDEKIACWKDQYGFDFSPLIPAAKKEFFGRPVFNHELHQQDCLAMWETVLVMDMKRFRVEELEEISQDFEFQVTREGTFHGFASWFSVEFGGFPSSEPPVVLNTGPEHEMTHWKQDLFMMDQPTPVREGDSIVGSILIKRNPEWRRHLRVTFTWELLKAGVKWGNQSQKQFLLWR